MKKFTDFFIEHPVFSASLSLLLLIIGLISFNRLSIRQYPVLSANSISITTTYTGANADTVESFVTRQIENAIAGVDHIDYIKSSSTAGRSRVVVYLTLNADVNAALEDINSDLAAVVKKFPDDVDTPIVKKIDPDAAAAMVISFTSTYRSAPQITDYLNRVIVPQLAIISGVGSVDLMGDRVYAMRLWLDPLKMAALHVSASDIENALKNNNLQAQAGSIQRDAQVLTINAKTDLRTSNDFEQLVIKHVGEKLVRLNDLGRVELGAESYSKSLWIDGKVGVGVGVTVKPSANPLQVSLDVHKLLDNLKAQMPEDISMIYAQDNAQYIKFSVHEVILSIIEAAVCVFAVIFLFLGSLRAVFIPIVTIPLSLVATFAFMFALGFTINVLTLLAFVFAIGMVVDDAIVVLENIHRQIESGLSALEAAIIGAREIVFVVIAMTFTLVAVYAPIGFTTGFTSILFKEFAFTLAAAVVISGFVALTLSPMMCSRLMKPRQQISRIEKKIEDYLNCLTISYQKKLNQVLHHRYLVVTAMFGVLILGAVFFVPLYATSTLAPTEDQGVLMGKASAPTGASITYTEKYTQPLQKMTALFSDITHSLIINGQGGSENNAMLIFRLKDWAQRKYSANVLQEKMIGMTNQIPGMKFVFYNPNSLPGATSSYSTEFIIKSTGSYAELYVFTQALAEQLEKNPGILSVESDLKLNNPELTIDIDRDKASIFGINMTDINTALNLAFGQPSEGSFVREGQSYSVIPQLETSYRNQTHSLDAIYVKTESNVFVPLANIISIKNTVGPNTLNHFQQQRAVALDLVLAPNFSEQEAINDFVKLLKTIPGSENVTYDFSGNTRQFIDSGNSMLIIFVFSLIFIYLVLSAQFESFIDPLIVMLTVPLALVGAIITLYAVGASLNIYTEIGLVTLIGLISKHGILMVAFANQLGKNNMHTKEAIQAAASVRLRPILMTTAAVILSALPLIFAQGAGSVARSQMGWTIAGGMLLGTLLTLFVIPTMYIIFKPSCLSLDD